MNLKSKLFGIACATALTAMPFTASAQVPGVALPIDGLSGILGSAGGLGGLTSLGGGLGGLGSLTSLGGGLGGLTSLGNGLDGLGQITPVITDLTSASGLVLPDFGFGLLDGGLATLSTLGLDIVQNILGGGGLSEIPLLGGDISAFLTPEGLISGASGLASFRLPIAIPVVGPEPLKLYAPVVLAILETQGLPVGGIPLPF